MVSSIRMTGDQEKILAPLLAIGQGIDSKTYALLGSSSNFNRMKSCRGVEFDWFGGLS